MASVLNTNQNNLAKSIARNFLERSKNQAEICTLNLFFTGVAERRSNSRDVQERATAIVEQLMLGWDPRVCN